MKTQHSFLISFLFILVASGCAQPKAQKALFQSASDECATGLGTFRLELTKDMSKPKTYILKVTAIALAPKSTIPGVYYAAFALANSKPEFNELTRGSFQANQVIYEDYLSQEEYELYPLFAVSRVYSATDDIAAGTSPLDGACAMVSNEVVP